MKTASLLGWCQCHALQQQDTDTCALNVQLSISTGTLTLHHLAGTCLCLSVHRMMVAAYAAGQQAGAAPTPGSTPFSQLTPAGLLNPRVSTPGSTPRGPLRPAGTDPAAAAAGGSGLLGPPPSLLTQVRGSDCAQWLPSRKLRTVLSPPHKECNIPSAAYCCKHSQPLALLSLSTLTCWLRVAPVAAAGGDNMSARVAAGATQDQHNEVSKVQHPARADGTPCFVMQASCLPPCKAVVLKQ
jgi:hypothetical protein